MIYETKFHIVEPETIETVILRNPVLGEVVAALSILTPEQLGELMSGLRSRTFAKAGLNDPMFTPSLTHSFTGQAFDPNIHVSKTDDLKELSEAQLKSMRELRQAVGDDKVAAENSIVTTSQLIRDYSISEENAVTSLTITEYKNCLDPFKHPESFNAAVADERPKFFDQLKESKFWSTPALFADVEQSQIFDPNTSAMWRGYMMAKGFLKGA